MLSIRWYHRHYSCPFTIKSMFSCFFLLRVSDPARWYNRIARWKNHTTIEHTPLAKMSFIEILDLTTAEFFFFFSNKIQERSLSTSLHFIISQDGKNTHVGTAEMAACIISQEGKTLMAGQQRWPWLKRRRDGFREFGSLKNFRLEFWTKTRMWPFSYRNYEIRAWPETRGSQAVLHTAVNQV